jgi:LysW-gamma-L-lysine carboxypeptidase
VWQCPALAYGPGDAALDHTPEEYIVVEEFWRSLRVLETVLEEVTVEG